MNSSVFSGLISDLANLKTGWKTSEFWVALSPIVVGILSVFGVGVSNDATTHFIVVGWSAVSGIYVTARTVLKTIHLGHVTSLAALLKQLEHEVINTDVPAQKQALGPGAVK